MYSFDSKVAATDNYICVSKLYNVVALKVVITAYSRMLKD